jgi:hypothetical protein
MQQHEKVLLASHQHSDPAADWWDAYVEAEKPTGQYLGLICDESLRCRDLNSNLGHFGSFTFIFVLFRESCSLASWCTGGRCGMACSDEDHGRSRRPSAKDRE